MTAASKQQIRQWFKEGKNAGYDFMIVCCDTFDWEDFPVYTKRGIEGFKTEYKRVMSNRIMEVYDLNMDLEMQMGERRAFHYPKGFSRIALLREVQTS